MGLLTVTLARTGTARKASNDVTRETLLRDFEFKAENRILINLPQWENECRWMLKLRKLTHFHACSAMSTAESIMLDYLNGLV
jgi:hypothetical protein